MWNWKEMCVLSRMCEQINAFGSDQFDEFVIHREDGRQQGIFKSWAIPVIPFLDFGNIEILDLLWPQLKGLAYRIGFKEALDELTKNEDGQIRRLALEILETINCWTKTCREKPLYLERSLERARLSSWLLDKNLTQVFVAESLSEDPVKRVEQLVNRLYLAFGLMAPFYNLEALVALPESHCWNPAGVSEKRHRSATGKLDVISFLLPAAFREHILAETLNWKGLNWNLLREETQKILKDKRKGKVLLNVSRLTGIPPHHVLFAANVLEWIPRRVGGKKSDSTSAKALAQLEEVLYREEPRKDGIAVLSQLNALIRFLNWVPLIEGEQNFEGRNWTYAAICDTTEDLLSTLKQHPELWRNGFAEVFKTKLLPQLVDLDATSAKGRFLLHLILKEHRLKAEVPLNQKWQEQVLRLVAKPEIEITGLLKNLYPTSLVGGKPFGLVLAGLALGKEFVPQGFVISTSTVELFLKEKDKLWKSIVRLHREEAFSEKLLLAKEIERAILREPLSCWLDALIRQRLKHFPSVNLWAVRSSSLDEGRARGVHKTLLRVSRGKCQMAVKKCIASYYNRKAVLFRKINKAGDLPCFAILLMPYLHGKGGVASRVLVGDAWQEIFSVGRTPAMVTAGRPEVQEITLKSDRAEIIKTEITRLLRDLSETFGQIQIEWVRREQVQILQMEILATATELQDGREEQCASIVTVTLRSHQDYPKLEDILRHRKEMISLRVRRTIDLGKFQGELLAIIAQYGKRIKEIHLDREISPSSHFANICQYFGIEIKFPREQ